MQGKDYSDPELRAMREWVDACDWQDLEPGEVWEMSDTAVIRCVERCYDGGVEACLRDAAVIA